MTATFDDGKDDGALRTIGELGKALGLKPHVLRYWEEQFPTLEPLKRSGNRRYYRPEDVALVEAIDRLVNHEGYTLKGARQAIEEGRVALGEQPDAKPSSTPAPAASPASDDEARLPEAFAPAVTGVGHTAPEIVAELKDIRDKLAQAVGA
ncbi:MerR family transcriptional regulator [Parerythrobacter jejuensis]|uniref:MerR family transcriptional regulator n=1 Tax=Parerythrobacter jejuensis TaxID=795812 RepID=A0A845ATJ6_9SPHN|nr:MerR family transcriptional regulator [Parerythrobacter jejuensis]MXP32829.1 MerR family transcriptional regulator [Parerythrobacter jejuensis]